MRKLATAVFGPAVLLALSASPLAAQDAGAPPPPSAADPATSEAAPAEAAAATDAAAPTAESKASDAATETPKARGGKVRDKSHPAGHAPATGSGER